MHQLGEWKYHQQQFDTQDMNGQQRRRSQTDTVKCDITRDQRKEGHKPGQQVLEVGQVTHDLVVQPVYQGRQHGNNGDHREGIYDRRWRRWPTKTDDVLEEQDMWCGQKTDHE